ncbi:Cobalamin biosynthesis protein CobD [Geodia barretti]|uniref:Cobalamin biosynthesis protein CobD n=1 Tax=Geodia barretti TaxID=519541 RepID=A0AA35TY29_GEOBA|nr:Cobalamin biosynthesis protein CobD [Geodia barretti]
MLLFAAPDWPVGPGVPFVLLIALALDALIGDPRWLPHPIRLMGWLTGLLDRTLNRERHGAVIRVAFGAVAVLLVAGVSAAAGWLIADQASALGWGWLAELALVTMLLAQRTMADHMVRVARALDTGADPARAAVRHIVGRDVRALDEYGIARAAIESGAENYSDGVVAPAFWYLLLGLPGLLAYKAINTMDSMIGHRSPRHHSPNAGWPEAAMAGALGLALLGPRHYEGEAAADEAGSATAANDATADDVRRTVWVFAAACALVAVLTAAIAAGTALSGS